eukprot:3809612-Rhodomonas_salina.1
MLAPALSPSLAASLPLRLRSLLPPCVRARLRRVRDLRSSSHKHGIPPPPIVHKLQFYLRSRLAHHLLA